jgi:hypothetical protein
MRRFLTGLAEAWPFVTVHARAIAFTCHVVCVYLSYISTTQVWPPATNAQDKVLLKSWARGWLCQVTIKTSVQFESVDIYPSVSELSSEQNARFRREQNFRFQWKQNVRFHVGFASRCLAYYIKNSVLIIRKEEQITGCGLSIAKLSVSPEQNFRWCMCCVIIWVYLCIKCVNLYLNLFACSGYVNSKFLISMSEVLACFCY